MTIPKPTFPNEDLRSICCEAKVHGHPESPSGDPTRCVECGEITGTYVLVSYGQAEKTRILIESWAKYIEEFESACNIIVKCAERFKTPKG